ncbi:MAG: glycosyltransferase family 39 protein [bacterium]
MKPSWNRNEWAGLILVLLVAAILRFWATSFGLPYIYHPDEGFEVYRALRLAMGGFDFERVAKGGYYFLLCLEFGIYFVLRFVTGGVSGVNDFALQFAADPSALWSIGRRTTALLGTFTVFLVWWQARRMGSSRAGLWGALFLAVSFRHVVDSHYVTVDIPMTLFAFWSVILVVEDVAGRSRLSWWKYALIAAFAVLNKLPAIVLFLPYFLGVFLRGGLRGDGGLLARRSWGPPVAAGVVYLVANPGFVINILDMFALFGDTIGGAGAGEEYVGVEQKTNLWIYYASVLLRSQGPGLLTLGLFGAIAALVRRSQGGILHLAFIVPFFALIAGATSAHLYYARYVVPMLPGLCLLAGLALDDLVRRVRVFGDRGSFAVALGVALLVSVEPAMNAIAWDRVQARTDTRTLAVEWIEQNVPNKSRVLLEGFAEDDAQLAIPLKNLKRNLKAMSQDLEKTDPGKAKFLALKLEAVDSPLFDLRAIRHYEPWVTLDEARADGVEWVVLRREYFVPGEKSAAKFDPGIVESRYEFRDELERRPDVAELTASFDADPDVRPGYDIEIWKIASNGGGADASADDPGDADE